jgi:hypothetical protein
MFIAVPAQKQREERQKSVLTEQCPRPSREIFAPRESRMVRVTLAALAAANPRVSLSTGVLYLAIQAPGLCNAERRGGGIVISPTELIADPLRYR